MAVACAACAAICSADWTLGEKANLCTLTLGLVFMLTSWLASSCAEFAFFLVSGVEGGDLSELGISLILGNSKFMVSEKVLIGSGGNASAIVAIA